MLMFLRHALPEAPVAPRIARRELVPWDESFSVGNPLIDSEHMEILRLLNLLYQDWQDGVCRFDIPALHDELVANFDLHFANEEEMLTRFGCPRLAEHKAEHIRLSRELEEIGLSLWSFEQAEGAERLAAFTRKMLIAHVRDYDMDLKTHGLQ